MANKHRLQSLQEEYLSDQVKVEAEDERETPSSDVDDYLIEDKEETGFNSIAVDLNIQFDNEEKNDLDLTMDEITVHKYLKEFFYLKVLFFDGNSSWISVDKVKDIES